MLEHWKCNTSSSSAGAQEKGKRGGYETSFCTKVIAKSCTTTQEKGKRGDMKLVFAPKISAKSNFDPC